MDALAGLLDGPRARRAFLLRSLLSPPWSLRIQDEAPLTVVAAVRGRAWLVPDEGEPIALHAGDVGLVRGPGHYSVADPPDTAPQVVVHPGQRCATPDGRDAQPSMHLGTRTWGNDPAGSTLLVTGTYQFHGEITRRLLDALHPIVAVRADDGTLPLVALLDAEVARDDPGQEAVLDRLLDLLLIAVLRTWFGRPDAPPWYLAQSDPVVGPALRRLYDDPAHGWTVASLARAVGVSRAALARRFTALVGETPMRFLAEWRLALAADLLREPGATVGGVARRVGYGSPYAFSSAFKRVRGVSPSEFQEAQRQDERLIAPAAVPDRQGQGTTTGGSSGADTVAAGAIAPQLP